MIPESIAGLTDPFSCLSHLIAAIIFFVIGIFLLRRTRTKLEFFCLASFVFSCVLLLSMSGTFHLLPRESSERILFQYLDHAAIFLLIAGTFTAVHGLLYSGRYRWQWLLAIWTVTITGIMLKMLYFHDIPEALGLVVYLTLGWLGVLGGMSIWRQFGFGFVRPLLLGGLAYSAGALVEYLGYPILLEGVLGPHELFHMAVLIGISFHWSFVSNSLRYQNA